MKRNLVIAAITAAALIGGGTVTAVAIGDDDRSGTATATASAPVPGPTASGDGPEDSGPRTDGSRDGTDDSRERAVPRGTDLTVGEAAAAALKKHPGSVVSAELDDDAAGRSTHWEVEVLGKDNRRHELKVDAVTGAVRADDRDDHADDRDDRDDRRGDDGRDD
ncbi:PepSY domain-containing protein [Streptomyces sp. NPDC006923]|uniref:PepSY domain-containing protein n=1 Tax=Streptomyces sp. NPDC006923 TaxID=3155355 RepID=UPI0033EAD6F2